MKPKFSRMTLILFLAALLLTSVACSFSSIQLENGKAKVTITLNEQQINDLLDSSNNNSQVESRAVLLKDITSVDMQEGILRVYGTYEAPDGREVEGSYDVAISAEDKQLHVQIMDVDIEGVDINDPRIEEANRQIESDLATSYRESNGEVEYESVEITDDAMTMVVQARLNNQ